jgi:hypothetical protein
VTRKSATGAPAMNAYQDCGASLPCKRLRQGASDRLQATSPDQVPGWLSLVIHAVYSTRPRVKPLQQWRPHVPDKNRHHDRNSSSMRQGCPDTC